jgi:hypothetical protein
MDDLTQLDTSKPAIRDHPDEIYGLYGQFYDDFDFDFGGPTKSGGLPSFESAIKIEAKFLTYNIGLARIGIRLFAIGSEWNVQQASLLWISRPNPYSECRGTLDIFISDTNNADCLWLSH